MALMSELVTIGAATYILPPISSNTVPFHCAVPQEIVRNIFGSGLPGNQTSLSTGRASTEVHRSGRAETGTIQFKEIGQRGIIPIRTEEIGVLAAIVANTTSEPAPAAVELISATIVVPATPGTPFDYTIHFHCCHCLP